MAALLKDPDRYVKDAVAKALSGQSVWPEGVFKNIVALLKDPEWYVRYTAAEALSRQFVWPEGVFKDMAALLKDSDPFVRGAAAGALSRQSAWPEGVLNLKDVAALLKDPEPFVRRTTAGALSRQCVLSDEGFSSIFLYIDSQSFNNLYDIWLRRSFKEHLAWYGEGNEISYIDMPEGSRKVPFDRFGNAVQ
ncbi:armadillo-type protein [Diplogelasinospora grovesii]|uniref:Armadillo-type protein n=1 Tax=Diplogelasinospora grovesii TaxID=303347 RepID=A0AAN6S812_9PEZI|nr:armadillo-type protein [Diplogelasinospora grovesii]